MQSIILTKKITISFKKPNPFSFIKTFYSESRFNSGLELYSDGCYYVGLNINNTSFGLKYWENESNINVDIYSQKKIHENTVKIIKDEINHRLSLNLNYNDFYKKFSSDSFLKEIIHRNKGKNIFCLYSLYENLIISTLLQNATIQRTIDMCSKMLSSYGVLLKYDNKIIYSIWQPKDLLATNEELRSLKVGYRSKNIFRITEHFCLFKTTEQSLRNLDDYELEKELLKIYGVGKQTVFYTMLGQFHRTGYLKHVPLWERKILSKYIFDKSLCDEKYIVSWMHENYKNWSGYALSMIFEDIFFQHRKKPFLWLKEIMREK